MKHRKINPNRWLTVHALLRKYDGKPYSVSIYNMDRDLRYYCPDISAIYSNIDVEIALSHVAEYKEEGLSLLIIIESK